MHQKEKRPVVHFGPQSHRRRTGQLKLALVLIIIFACLYWLGSGCYDSYHAAGLQRYTGETLGIIESANKQNGLFQESLAPGNGYEKMKKVLGELEKTSAADAAKARMLEAPRPASGANELFVLFAGLREQAFARYKDSLINAVSDQDPQVAMSQILTVWQDLSLSDRAFELWRQEILELMQTNGGKASELPVLQKTMDPQSIDRGQVVAFIDRIKQEGALSAVHGIGIVELTSVPAAQLKNENNNLYAISKSRKIKAKVVVENQGNQPEEDLVVKMELKSQSRPVEQIDQKVIDRINPGEKVSLVFEDINATDEGVVYLLAITAGPLPGESVLDNNRVELKFVVI